MRSGSLPGHFNHMGQTLKALFGELEEKNRQLAEQFVLVSRSQKEWQETFDRITDPIAVIDHTHCLIRANRALKETFNEYFSEAQDEGSVKDGATILGGNFLSHDTDFFGLQDRRPTTKEIHDPRTGKIFEVSLFPYSFTGGRFYRLCRYIEGHYTEKRR